MKNWNYIEGAKTGNEKAISSTFYMNDYGVEVGQWSWDWRGKAPDEKKQNEIAQKIKSYVQQINKNVPAGDSDERDEVFSKLDKFVRSQGLNKKVGNGVAADITTDGNIWIVTTSDGKKKEFPSEPEAEAYVKKIKTGNIKDDAKAKDLYKKMMDAKEIAEEWGRASNYQKKDNLEGGRKAAEDEYRKAKKAYEDYAMNKKTGNEEKTGAEEFFKKLSDDVKEREKKDNADIEKVGNANLETSVEKGKLGLWNWYVHKDGTIVSGGTSSTEANAKEMARKALEKEKVGNFKTGTSALKPGDRVQSYGVQGTVRKVEGENSDNIYGEPIIEVEWDNGTVKKVGEHYLRKIGNKVGNSTVSEYNSEIQRLTKKAEQLRRMGQGRQAMEVEKQIEKLGKELSEIGNSAQDDKFAYVMREFDAGKLKTPDGKVVTDPAQAKAIAYSESKKTENGLARARKAIK